MALFMHVFAQNLQSENFDGAKNSLLESLLPGATPPIIGKFCGNFGKGSAISMSFEILNVPNLCNIVYL